MEYDNDVVLLIYVFILSQSEEAQRRAFRSSTIHCNTVLSIVRVVLGFSFLFSFSTNFDERMNENGRSQSVLYVL